MYSAIKKIYDLIMVVKLRNEDIKILIYNKNR